MAQKVVFERNEAGNVILNREGLALARRIEDGTLIYVRPVQKSTSKLSKEPLNKQGSTLNQPMDIQIRPSKMQFAKQSQDNTHMTEVSATPSREDRCSKDGNNEDAPPDKALWPSDAIKALMAEYKDRAYSFQINVKGHNVIWKQISARLRMCGYPYTDKQCENKLKNLKKKYHAKVDNMKSKQSGAAPVRFDYFDDDDGTFEDEVDENKPCTIVKNEKKRGAVASPKQSKGKKTKFEKAIFEMKEAIYYRTQQQNLRQERLLAAYEKQTDGLVQSIDKLIDKL